MFHSPITTTQRKFFVKDLNTHLVCSLCDGYFREAHTVPDCLHTFCKCCLFKEFAKKAIKDAKTCPTCKCNLGLRPYDKVVYDRNLQALVDKIFPHFAAQDKILEEQFYATCEQEEEINNQSNMLVRPRLFPQSAPKRQLVSVDNNNSHPNKKVSLKSSSGTSSSKCIPPVDDSIGLTLRVVPYNTTSSNSDIPSSFATTALPSLTKPLLRVSANSVSLDKIQRFIHKRMGAPSTFAPDDIEILRDGVIQLASSSISHYPILDSTVLSGLDANVKPQSLTEKVIILTYRQSVKLEERLIFDTDSCSIVPKHS